MPFWCGVGVAQGLKLSTNGNLQPSQRIDLRDCLYPLPKQHFVCPKSQPEPFFSEVTSQPLSSVSQGGSCTRSACALHQDAAALAHTQRACARICLRRGVSLLSAALAPRRTEAAQHNAHFSPGHNHPTTTLVVDIFPPFDLPRISDTFTDINFSDFPA